MQETARLRAKRRFHLRDLVFHVLVIALAIVMVYPLLWMLTSSFKPGTEIFKTASFLPETWTLDNYSQGWQGISGYSFWVFLSNSLSVVAMVMLGNVFSCSLTAFAFAKIRFPLSGFWFAIMLGTLMLPFHARLIPQYVIFNSLGWVNTYIPLILPKFFATEGFFVFMMTQYMRGLPKEMVEASRIDGCGYFMHYWRIILPLTVPSIITTCIFSFIWTWNDFFSQMIYLSKIETYTVALALRQYVDAMGNSYWGALFAMSIVSLIPLLVIFIGFQRFLMDGVTMGSIKG